MPTVSSGMTHVSLGSYHKTSGTIRASLGSYRKSSGLTHASLGSHHNTSGLTHASLGSHHKTSGLTHASLGTTHCESGLTYASLGTSHALATGVKASLGTSHAFGFNVRAALGSSVPILGHETPPLGIYTIPLYSYDMNGHTAGTLQPFDTHDVARVLILYNLTSDTTGTGNAVFSAFTDDGSGTYSYKLYKRNDVIPVTDYPLSVSVSRGNRTTLGKSILLTLVVDSDVMLFGTIQVFGSNE